MTLCVIHCRHDPSLAQGADTGSELLLLFFFSPNLIHHHSSSFSPNTIFWSHPRGAMMSPAIRAGSVRAMAFRASTRLGMPSTSSAAQQMQMQLQRQLQRQRQQQIRGIFQTRSWRNDKTAAILQAAQSDVQTQLPPPEHANGNNANGKKCDGEFEQIARDPVNGNSMV